MFNYAIMAHTPADDPEVVNGRVTEVPLEQLTGDYNQKNFMVKFRVNETRGNEQHSKFLFQNSYNLQPDQLIILDLYPSQPLKTK